MTGDEPIVLLNMIVKNESKVIRRCLDSVKWVDGVLIADTGSVDNTVDIIKQWMKKHDKIGTIFSHEWKNFGHNRTKAFKEAQEWVNKHLAGQTVYFLFLDADMCFPQGARIKARLEKADVWDVPQETGSMIYKNLRLARSSLEIEIKCPTHEYYDILTKDYVRKSFDEIRINDIGDGGSKSDKVERDIRLLKQGLVEEPDNIRYWFYLANTLRDKGDYNESIKAYDERIKRKGWYEELYCAYLYKGDCLMMMGEKEKALYTWLEAYNTDSWRLEALCRIARELRIEANHSSAMLFIEKGLQNLEKKQERMLFLEKPAYDYLLTYELSICAYYVGMKERGRKASLELLARKNIPNNIKKSVESNLRFYS